MQHSIDLNDSRRGFTNSEPDRETNRALATSSENAVIITRRHSKPSRHDIVPIITPAIRQRQRNRYSTYRDRLAQGQLYSLVVSASGLECHEAACQPSFFNASCRCRTAPMESRSLLNERDIKPNMSYLSLTDLSNLIDHEPNVSRKDSFTQSSSHVLTHKPSSFLADVFNKMTHEQRARSIMQLTKWHESLSRSNLPVNQLQRTTSLPNLNTTMAGKLHSVTSLFAEEAPPGQDVPASRHRTADRSEASAQSDTRPSNVTDPSVETYLSVSNPPLSEPESDTLRANVHVQSRKPSASVETDKDHVQRSQSIVQSAVLSPLKLVVNAPLNDKHQIIPQTAMNTVGPAETTVPDDTLPSLTTRTVTASTNLPTADDDDEQSKQINEQLKRSSLRLARDSLELLRSNTPRRRSSDERLTPTADVSDSHDKRKSALKSRIISSDELPTPEATSYMTADSVQEDDRWTPRQVQRRSLTVDGATLTCASPKPKRDSISLLQQRYADLTTPHSDRIHLPAFDGRHVEFIRGPGNTVTPVMHVGRGMRSKHPTSKPITPVYALSERPASEMSLHTTLQRVEDDACLRQVSSTTTIPFVSSDSTREKRVCLDKRDYDDMLRLAVRPLLKKNRKRRVHSSLRTHMKLRTHDRLTMLQSLLLLILLIFFYIVILVKSQYCDHSDITFDRFDCSDQN